MPVIFTETWPEGYTQRQEGYLYNHEAFVPLQLGPKTSYRSFYAVDTSAGCIVGKVHFFRKTKVNEPTYRSPEKCPFGSFELLVPLTASQIDAFVQYVLSQLQEEQSLIIQMLHHATIYHRDNTALIKASLLKAGFRVKEAILNHHIMIDRYSLENKMHHMEMRRLVKCHKAGFSFREENLSTLANVYNFILACREERGWGLSMTFTALQKAVSTFPENYKLFSVYDGSHRIATTVAVVVNSRILYNFYPASLVCYHSYSPTVMLIDGLYWYCQQKGMEILDLGTSATASLQRFKEHLGGEVSCKYDFIFHSSK